MNYLSEIIAFEQWLENNYLPISAQLLWYKLMNRFNRTGWSEWITVDNQRLMADMQIIREATFISIRDKLIQEGLIEYKKGKKGSPGKYKMVSFAFKNEVKSVVQSEVKSVVQSVGETVDIYKYKQKQKQNIKEKNIKKEIRHQYGQYNNVLLSDTELEKLKSEFSDYEQRIERLSEYIASTGKTYKNHLATIRSWSRRDNKSKDDSTETKQSYDIDFLDRYWNEVPKL